jgi:para-aminobenzoate synthetase component 1
MLLRELHLGVGLEAVFVALRARPHCFFLDSALPSGDQEQFSFIGFDPFLVFRVGPGGATIAWADGRTETRAGDPLEALRELHRRHGVPRAAHPAVPFAGGAVGFFSYEFGLRFERIARTIPDDFSAPEAEFGFYDGAIVHAQATGKIFAATNAPDEAAATRILDRLERTVRDSVEALAARATVSGAAGAGGAAGTGWPTPMVTANFTRSAYLQAVERVRDYIRAGDVYQVNLSQRFETPLPCDPALLYLLLRQMSPAPFGCFLGFGGFQAASVSPERFLRVRGSAVSTRPIKGTRRRGLDEEEDARLRTELLTSAKDRAELLMIVDLERNDLGRVCEPGSIEVDEMFVLEEHPTVFHLVAEVSGRLAAGRDAFDCLRAAFPGGSITGAPKIRAMQIIDELEPHRRHLYTGAMGYLGFDGDCELNVAIRTIQCAEGRAIFHAGGGIVWDSDPAAEYDETLAKARALRDALESWGEPAP